MQFFHRPTQYSLSSLIPSCNVIRVSSLCLPYMYTSYHHRNVSSISINPRLSLLISNYSRTHFSTERTDSVSTSSSSSSSLSTTNITISDDIHDPLRLAITILQRHNGSMHPSALMKEIYNTVNIHKSLQDEDQFRKELLKTEGNGISFVKRYPTIFTIDWEVRRCGDTSVMEYQRAAKCVRLLPEIMETLTQPLVRPSFSVWGPLIIEELEKVPNHIISIKAFTARIHAVAFAKGYRMPPGGALSWCFTNDHDPYLSRIRPIWSVTNVKKGPPKIEAVQLLPIGETALQKDIEELRNIAASI